MFVQNRWKTHAYAKLFPPLSHREFRDLAKDIRKNGLKEPIWVYQNKILDGVHRYEACILAMVQPRYERLPPGKDPWKFVCDKNIEARPNRLTSKEKVAFRNHKPNQPAGKKNNENGRTATNSDTAKSFARKGSVSDGNSINAEADIARAAGFAETDLHMNMLTPPPKPKRQSAKKSAQQRHEEKLEKDLQDSRQRDKEKDETIRTLKREKKQLTGLVLAYQDALNPDQQERVAKEIQQHEAYCKLDEFNEQVVSENEQLKEENEQLRAKLNNKEYDRLMEAVNGDAAPVYAHPKLEEIDSMYTGDYMK